MSEQVQLRILSELAANTASAFEGMTGERPAVGVRAAGAPPGPAALVRRQEFAGAAGSLKGALWIAAEEADWQAIGCLMLQAAGVSESDPGQLKSEFLEIVNQAVSGVARAMSQWAGHEVRPERAETVAAQAGLRWSALDVKQGETSFVVFAAVEGLIDEPRPVREQPQEKSPTFDLLLDVEMPISVSFGRAEVPLKDVLKLTTGSIVELNRDLGDPVEVIVNNCVIARGEVVTVEGNFGVRIQEVVSRQERWKTVG